MTFLKIVTTATAACAAFGFAAIAAPAIDERPSAEHSSIHLGERVAQSGGGVKVNRLPQMQGAVEGALESPTGLGSEQTEAKLPLPEGDDAEASDQEETDDDGGSGGDSVTDGDKGDAEGGGRAGGGHGGGGGGR